jgi:uncharacterized protein YabN with tetrapyrrole methylase and pyrophosphatase domain
LWRSDLTSPVSSFIGAIRDEELGDLLFSVVNLARFRKIDPELVLAAANEKFERRFSIMEQLLKDRGYTLEAATASQMDDAWEAAKKRG